jgi:hypothetical protein
MNRMANSTGIPIRHSRRMFLSVRIRVRGKQAGGRTFEEQTETAVVSAHGALILLETPVGVGQNLRLLHRINQEEVEARVVYLGDKEAGKMQVGVQFPKPSPHFWGVAFPPDDWSPHLRRDRSLTHY